MVSEVKRRREVKNNKRGLEEIRGEKEKRYSYTLYPL